MTPRLFLLVLVASGLIAAGTTRPAGTRYFSQPPPPDAELTRLLGRSHLSLVTDLFWIRAISLSTSVAVPVDGLTLIAWCHLVSELDPTFVYPYILGGLLGPVPVGDTFANVERANELLRRGVENVPADPRLPLYLAYNQLNLLDEPLAAAETLRLGASRPGAPLFMGLLATRLLAQSNRFEAAHAFAAELEHQASDPETRAFFERRRLEVERDALMVELQAAVDAYRGRSGRLPATLDDLVTEGSLPAIPADPVGGRFMMLPDGTVASTSGQRLRAKEDAMQQRKRALTP